MLVRMLVDIPDIDVRYITVILNNLMFWPIETFGSTIIAINRSVFLQYVDYGDAQDPHIPPNQRSAEIYNI